MAGSIIGAGAGSGPAINAAAVLPSDTVDLVPPARGLYIGTAGDVTVNMAGGQASILFSAVAAGTVLPVCVTRVLATGTSAGSIVALW